MPEERTKAAMLDNLRTMLRDARLSRAHGYVDGYMRALIETGAATQKELLEVVSAERVTVDGPATSDVKVVAA